MALPDDDMTDERWRVEAAAIGAAWEPAQISIAANDDNGAPFGWRKASFGIWEGGAETAAGWLELSSLTHLKTGMRIALFSHPEHAAAAADLAERIGDWSELDERGINAAPEWKPKIKAMYASWQAAGFIYGPLTDVNGKGIWCAPEPVDKARLS